MSGDSTNGYAYVLTCFDPANFSTLVQKFDQEIGKGRYFFPPAPGGVKSLLGSDQDRNYVLSKIETARKVHPFGRILLINHSQCGAYRMAGMEFSNPEEEEVFHRQEMEKAAEILRRHFPEVSVETHYFRKDLQQMAW